MHAAVGLSVCLSVCLSHLLCCRRELFDGFSRRHSRLVVVRVCKIAALLQQQSDCLAAAALLAPDRPISSVNARHRSQSG